MPPVTRVNYPNYRPVRKTGIVQFALIFPIALSGVASGGATGATYHRDVLDKLGAPFVSTGKIEPYATKYAPSVAQHLFNIREMFNLNMSEIARVFNVSRPAAYAWLAGTFPKPEIVQRIYSLSSEVETLRSEGFVRLGSFLRRPLTNGKTLLDILQSGEDPKEAVAFLKRTAMREANARSLAPSRHSRAKKSGVTTADEILAPIVLERQS